MTKKWVRRTKKADMSPDAIDRRLMDVAELYKFGMSIQSSRRVGEVRELRKQPDSAGQDPSQSQPKMNMT